MLTAAFMLTPEPAGDALILPAAVQTFVGVGAPAAFAIAFALWVARKAIAQAVIHAASAEMARPKSELDKELENHKSNLQRETERFRAELTLGAEVRRLVAAHRVNSTIDVIRLAAEVGGQLRTVPLNDLVSRNQAVNTVGALVELIHAQQHFIGQGVQQKLIHKCEALVDRLRRGMVEDQSVVAAAFTNEVTLICSENLCLELHGS